MNFPAAQIAQALGCTRQAIQQRLAAIAPAGQAIVHGNAAAAWHLAALPSDLQNELSSIAERQGFGQGLPAVQSMMAAPPPPWQPRVAIGQVPQGDLDNACKLRSVLEPFLRGHKLDTRCQADREAAGVAAYQKEFGYVITGRHFRSLFSRTVARDNGREDWMRVETYLADNIGAASAPVKPDRDFHAAHESALGDTIRTLENPAAPTEDDRKFLFDASFRHLESARAAGPENAPACKRTLLDFLLAAVPALAPNRAALKVVFNYKLRAWTEAGGAVDALQDRRAIESGNFRKTDFGADLEKIRNEAILHDGNMSLAYRKLRQAGQLSDGFVKHYRFDARHNKSYLPGGVRAAITSEVRMCGPIHRGPHEAKMRGPYIPRDWSNVAPGDWFSGDDVTWNNYFYFNDSGGKLHIERGECLVFHDLRTGYILDFMLIAGKYNSRHIRKGLLKVHDRFGLPRLGYYFERGVWKARVITDLAANESLHWRETESGLASYNLQVRHATTPRAKPIEGLFRILQERQRNEQGYVSGNERAHEMERMQDFLARARAGKAKPGDRLLSMDQWCERLSAILAEFNHDAQNGKMLNGQSPSEAWQAGLAEKPLRQLPETSRYLLATHCKKLRVRQEGIVLNIGKNRMLFCNEQTGSLIGQDVLVYYNLECPDLLTVSDLNRQNYFTVKAMSLPAMSASKEQFSVARAAVAGHTRHARELYGSIPRQSSYTVRNDRDASQETAALGEFHNAETARFKTEQAAETRTLGKIQLASAGRPISTSMRNPGRVLEGIEMENAWRAEQNAAEFEAAEIPAPPFDAAGGKKIYELKSAPGAVPSVGMYWSLWAKIKKAKPGITENFRHALTQKSIGCHATPQNQTPEQLAKMISVLSAVLRDAPKVTI